MLTEKEIGCLEILCADGERHWAVDLEEVIGREITVDELKDFRHDEIMYEVNEDGDIIFFEKPKPEIKQWLITYLYKGMGFNTIYEAATAEEAQDKFYSEWTEDEYDLVLGVDEYEEDDFFAF